MILLSMMLRHAFSSKLYIVLCKCKLFLRDVEGGTIVPSPLAMTSLVIIINNKHFI